MTNRIPLDDLTSDQLDQLYDRAERTDTAEDAPAAPGSCGHRSTDGHPCDVEFGHLGYHRNIRNDGDEWTTWVGEYPTFDDDEKQP